MDRSLRREARVVLAEEVSAALDGSSTMVLISDCRVMSAETNKVKESPQLFPPLLFAGGCWQVCDSPPTRKHKDVRGWTVAHEWTEWTGSVV